MPDLIEDQANFCCRINAKGSISVQEPQPLERLNGPATQRISTDDLIFDGGVLVSLITVGIA